MSSSPFESATRVAIEEIIKNRASQSRFGSLITEESMKDLIDDIFDLLMTSRSLKAGGDRLLQAGLMGGESPTKKPTLPRR